MLLEPGEEYRVHHGDVIPHLAEMPSRSVDLAVYSPPFPSVYAYTSLPEDIGNSEDLRSEAKLHFSFFFRGMLRVMKPGRVMVVHCTQIPRMKRSGGQGLFDFRGMLIRLGERAGFVFDYDWAVAKNPQAQAIRTKSHQLQFAGLERDRANSRGAIPDYLLKFVAPGENAVPIDSEGEVRRNDWIEWAECCWSGIRETNTLNVSEGRGEDDTKHICLARGSLVLTRDGHKPIENVEVGDMVLTHRGRWRHVVAMACNGVKPVVKVEAQGVADLRMTPDHLLWTRLGVGEGRWPGMAGGTCHPRATAMKTEPCWVPAADTKASYINLKLPPIEESLYSAHDWWVVGRWLGDGHWDTRNHLHISCGRHEIDRLLPALGERAGFVADTGTSKQVRVKDRDGRLRELLTRCGRGASTKRLPAEALALDLDKAEALLSGYLSADGHYVARYDRWSATSVSRPLLLGMAMVAQRARGVACSVHLGRPGGTCAIQGRTVNTLDQWVLSIPPRNLSGFMLDDGAWKKVRRVEPAGESEVWDIQVEEDHSFTAEGCIVHNCPLQLDVIERLVRLYSNPGETVFSPFAGLGSEGFVALKLGRRFYGAEIKDEYHAAAMKNLARAVRIRDERVTGSLFATA